MQTTRPVDRRGLAAVTGALALAALAVAAVYFRLIDSPFLVPRLRFHEQLLRGVSTSPYQYQVLSPLILEWIRGALDPVVTRAQAFLAAGFLFTWLASFFSLSALYRFLRLWFPAGPSLLGALCAASMTLLTMRDHFYHPWSYLEPGFYATALRWMIEGRNAACLVWMIPAALNRETAVFLVAAHAVIRRERGSWRWTAAMAAAWLAVFAGLRMALGHVQGDVPVGLIWRYNLVEWKRSAWNLLLFLGPVSWLAWRGWARAPRALKGAASFVPFYAAAITVFGIWYEIRMFLTFLTVLIPLALCGVFEPSAKERAPASESA